MIDTHTHLQFDTFQADLGEVLKRMSEEGVSQAIVVGVDVQTSQRAVELASQYRTLFAAVGVHPGDVAGLNLDTMIASFEALISEKTVAIGEIGLDYKVFDNVEPNKRLQQAVFDSQIALANRHHLPAILHSRQAETDLINFIQEHPLSRGGVVHCYTGDYATAKRALDCGLAISFTAMITYPKNEALCQVVAQMPHDRVMLETDCPFLPPEGLRGQRNEPARVVAVAQTVAALWGRDIEYVDSITTANAQKFFYLPNT